MRRPRHRIVIFEDDPRRAQRLAARVNKALRNLVVTTLFEPSSQSGSDDLYESRLKAEIDFPQYSNALLFVSDRDLSKTKGYVGLSEASVTRVATDMNVPVALYAQGASYNVLERRTGWGDGVIVLQGKSTEAHAREIVVLTKGFLGILQGSRRLLRRSSPGRSPAAVMAALMGRGEYADRVAQYGVGDQKYFAGIVPSTTVADKSSLERRMVRLFGTWLYDSILRFPGLLVSGKAAASYLDIAPSKFLSDKSILKVFSKARYLGPFSDDSNPVWWRPDLDDLLADNDCDSGRDLVKKKVGADPGRCRCSVDGTKRAGYFCMVTNEPVSAEESEGAVSWFPPGADLARVNKSDYEELRPWLATY